MKRLIASAAIALPLVFATFVTQANAGITIRLGNTQNDGYRRDIQREPVFVTPRRNVRVIERRDRRVWVPAHWNYRGRQRAWVPGHYIYR